MRGLPIPLKAEAVRYRTPEFLGICVMAFCALSCVSQAQGESRFKQEIQPVLQKHCFKCHGGRRRLKAGLDITTRAGHHRRGYGWHRFQALRLQGEDHHA